MKAFLLVAALLLSPQPTNPGKALLAEDLIGSWSTTQPVTQGETTNISFREDGSVMLIRHFPERPVQGLVASPAQVRRIDDLIVINFNHGRDLKYRLVLSGWKIRDTRQVFGTLFMYGDGVVFNGIPVSFRRAVDCI